MSATRPRGCTACSSSSTGWSDGCDALRAREASLNGAAGEVALWLDPLGYLHLRDRLFDAASEAYSGDRIVAPYAHLRERLAEHGIGVHTADLLLKGELPPARLNLYATMGLRTHYRRMAARDDTILSAFLVNECPVVEPRLFADLDAAAPFFRRLYSFAPDEAMAEFLERPLAFRPARFPYPFEHVDEAAWSNRDRSFLTVVAMNKVPRLKTRELYTERKRAVAYFAQHGEVDLYGKGWSGPSFRVGETRVPRRVRNVGYRLESLWDRVRPDPLLTAVRAVYRGPVVSTVDTLARYTFSICFENMVMAGWVTEKIFHALRAGTIPVYLGASDVGQWVWPECFVDMRRFSDYDELREFLRGLSPAEIEAYRDAGREYFASPEFRPFSKEAFADRFVELVREDGGVPL